MYEPFTWQLLLSATPSRVFCSLVRAAGQSGRVCGIEDYGTVLIYAPGQGEVDSVGRMRASVRDCPEGTLVTISAADQSLVGPVAFAVHADAVATLIHQLRMHYAEQELQVSA